VGPEHIREARQRSGEIEAVNQAQVEELKKQPSTKQNRQLLSLAAD
jgi:hypothetical protein